MRIGEKMSNKVDMGTIQVVGGIYKDIYEDEAHVLVDQPLDTGRLLYAKLRLVFIDEPDIEIEVWWNHFTNRITAQLKSGREPGSTVEMDFKNQTMARLDRLIFIDNIIEAAKEWSLSLPSPS